MEKVMDGLGSGCGEQVEPTRTFPVKLRVLDDEYRIDEKARFRVSVHRVVRRQDVDPVEGSRSTQIYVPCNSQRDHSEGTVRTRAAR